MGGAHGIFDVDAFGGQVDVSCNPVRVADVDGEDKGGVLWSGASAGGEGVICCEGLRVHDHSGAVEWAGLV